jgi:trehalose 6-phosphate phosphatase
MTATYLLSPEGLAALAAQVAPDTLFAFDLDGTLAPIVNEFNAARVAGPVRSTLERLAGLAKVSVITGRSRKAALEILGFEPHLLIGNHGAEWPDGPDSRNVEFVELCTAWRKQLQERLCGVRGVEIEFKGESIAIHYRRATDRVGALTRIDAAIADLDPAPKRIGGKYVVNILPMEARGKGDALVAAMEMFGVKRAIFIGDDVTDEEVFTLESVDMLGVHVGKDSLTAAPYYLNDQAEMAGLLKAMVGMLKSQEAGAAP